MVLGLCGCAEAVESEGKRQAETHDHTNTSISQTAPYLLI